MHRRLCCITGALERPNVGMYMHRVAGPLLPIGNVQREVLGFGSILVAILPSCQYMKKLHSNRKDMNIVGY